MVEAQRRRHPSAYRCDASFSRVFRGRRRWRTGCGLPFNDRLRALAGGPIIPGLRKAIAPRRADVVVAASFPLLHMFDALAAARASGRPCVLIGCLHPDDQWGFERPMIYDAIREADAYIALTTYEAAHVVARGAHADRVHAIGVGVDAQRFQGFSTEEAKWRLGFDRRPVVGFIGQLAQHKGIDTLLRAMPAVWRYEPEVNLLIAGGRTLFAERVEQIVREWPEAFRRRTRIHLGLPRGTEALSCSRRSTCLACPSAFESFGITYLEAWAAGKPVIGARAGAVPTVIDEGVDGLLVDYDDELALAREVVDLVREPSRATRMGEAGRAKVLARYAWPLIARSVPPCLRGRHRALGEDGNTLISSASVSQSTNVLLLMISLSLTLLRVLTATPCEFLQLTLLRARVLQ